jgi:hypothetical protein
MHLKLFSVLMQPKRKPLPTATCTVCGQADQVEKRVTGHYR